MEKSNTDILAIEDNGSGEQLALYEIYEKLQD